MELGIMGEEELMAKKTGRPKIEIDWEDFEKLCILQCTEEEIASFFGCSADTISRRVTEEYKMSFAMLFEGYKRKGRISLRRLQWQAAKKGSVQMLIWLGKQYLAQKDRIEATGLEGERRPIVMVHRSFETNKSYTSYKEYAEARDRDEAKRKAKQEATAEIGDGNGQV